MKIYGIIILGIPQDGLCGVAVRPVSCTARTTKMTAYATRRPRVRAGKEHSQPDRRGQKRSIEWI